MKKYILPCLIAPFLLGNTATDVFKENIRSWYKIPPIVHVSILAQLSEGMSRRQVRELIGTPHFNEGVIVTNWQYLFDISANGRLLGKQCQLRIDFHERRVKQMRWEDPDCAQLVK